LTEFQQAPAATTRVANALRKATPYVRRFRALARTAIVWSAAAVAVIAYALFFAWAPESGSGWTVHIVIVALLALAPVLLGVLWLVLGEVVALPDRIESLPGDARSHLIELSRLWQAVSDNRRKGLAGWFRNLWALRRVVASSRELLTPYAPFLPFASGPFLLASLWAFVLAASEVIAAAIVLLVLAL
jgi:hypothetical protein